MFATEEGGRGIVSLFEEFYEVRDIGEAALDTDLRHSAICGGEHNLGSHKPLFDNPTMRRHIEDFAKLLLEGGE